MKSLKNVAACAIACALCSAAPTHGVDPKPAPTERDARQQVAERYVAPAALAQPAPGITDPKWLQSLQQGIKELAQENGKLRTENDALRADNEALKRQLQENEAQVRKWRQNRGMLEIPPEALKVVPQPQGNAQVPPNWRPFQFNGATYYMIPLKHGQRPAAPPPLTRDAVDVTGGELRGAGTVKITPAPESK